VDRGADGEVSQFLGTVVPRTVLETFLASQDAALKHLQDAASSARPEFTPQRTLPPDDALTAVGMHETQHLPPCDDRGGWKWVAFGKKSLAAVSVARQPAVLGSFQD